jgi:hypothetical protein
MRQVIYLPPEEGLGTQQFAVSRWSSPSSIWQG